MGRPRLIGAAALPLILILAACTSGAGATPTPTTAPTQPAASQPPASQAPASQAPSQPAASPTSSAESGDAYELKIAAGSGAVTNFLTGKDGMTLYLFKNDTVNSGKSTCNADCAATWPPYLVDELDEVKPDSGITGKLALITRDDGKKQLSYKGWPLYYFSGDKKAGDTAGQGLFGKWFVVNP